MKEGKVGEVDSWKKQELGSGMPSLNERGGLISARIQMDQSIPLQDKNADALEIWIKGNSWKCHAHGRHEKFQNMTMDLFAGSNHE